MMWNLTELNGTKLFLPDDSYVDNTTNLTMWASLPPLAPRPLPLAPTSLTELSNPRPPPLIRVPPVSWHHIPL